MFTASKRSFGTKRRLGFERVTERPEKEKQTIVPLVEKKEVKIKIKKKGRLKHLLKGAKEFRHPFAAFVKSPKIKFETQGENEEVILLLRSHWVTNIPWIFLAFLGIFGPFFWPFLPFGQILPLRFQLVLILFWYLLIAGFVFEKFLSWYFNVMIVTNFRVVDIDFFSLMYKEVSDAELEKIEDVTYRMGGILRAFLNYGDIYIQTAAEKAEFDFQGAPKPEQVVEIIQDLLERK